MKLTIKKNNKPDEMIKGFKKCAAYISGLSISDRNKIVQALKVLYYTEGLPTRKKAKKSIKDQL